MTALLYNAPVTGGASGYAPIASMVDAYESGKAVTVWRLGARIMSMALGKEAGGGRWKVAERLATDDPDALLDALESAGVRHPSSFGDCYHQLAPETPKVRRTFNGMFEWWPGGPWSEARATGKLDGLWRRYDLVSAYRWAATLGLPNPETYQAVRAYSASLPGLYVCELRGPDRPDLPTIFRLGGPVVASTEEIETMGLSVRVLRGVVWTDSYSRTYVESTLRKLPCAKESGRAYWGRWIAHDPLIRWDRKANKETLLFNGFANFIWGWLILGRVRLRLWEHAREAAHVYVDEVVTREELPTGNGLGHWHLKDEYPRGIVVQRTGAYGPANGPLTMQTGVKRHGPQA